VEALSVRLGRKLVLIAESDLNDARVLRSREQGGFGLDSQWSDDFHHSLHELLTGERDGYYSDFSGVSDLAAAYNDAFVYAGRYSAFRGRRHGNAVSGFPGGCFVVCAQNHDQVGNRMMGDRLSCNADFEREKLAAGALLTAPYVPLLFMGQEYGETAPFLYFVSHSDPELAKAVRDGRRREFEHFRWQGEVPDPQAEETFKRSVLRWELREKAPHSALLAFYRELLRLRSVSPALSVPDRSASRASADETGKVLLLERGGAGTDVSVFMNFSSGPAEIRRVPAGAWRRLIDSADERWAGPGTSMPDVLSNGAVMRPWSVCIYERTR